MHNKGHHIDPICRIPSRPVSLDPPVQPIVQQITEYELPDIKHLNIIVDFEENDQHLEGIITETYQGLDKFYF